MDDRERIERGLSPQTRDNTTTLRAETVLLLSPAVEVSYDTLQQWLAANQQIRRVAVLSPQDAARLAPVLPTSVYAVPGWAGLASMRSIPDLWRELSAIVGRFETVLVLCLGDAEVMTGQTVHRLLAELLLGDRVVLIGPRVSKEWPGGRGLTTPGRARELAPLAVATGLALATTAAVLAAVAAQEAAVRLLGRGWTGR